MLAWIAAVAPTLASLYVAGSYLVEFSRRNHAKRVLDRVDSRLAVRQAALLEKLRHGADGQWYESRKKELSALRRRLLEYHGIDPSTGTIGGVRQQLTRQGISVVEMRRQWVSLLGASVGVALLALDLPSAP